MATMTTAMKKIALLRTTKVARAATIQFMQGPADVPMAVALTAVMAPEAYNYVDSKQIIGMLNGLKGGNEYEQLLGVFGKASRASNSSSFAHLLIISFIALGNVAMLLERRQRARLSGLHQSATPSRGSHL